jgi:aspartate aminotransferase-like enzyme
MLFSAKRTYRLMTPGPVPLSPAVRETLSLPMIHHRTPEFDAILKSVMTKLKKTFLTKQPVFMHAATGSGAMESAIVNTLSPGDEVLTIVTGKFGERWNKICEAYGIKYHALNVPWGEAVKVAEVERLLQTLPNVKAVLCQASETSTATMNPVRELADVVRRRAHTIFIVDAITALGAMPLAMDDWGLDVVVSGSQKAFMLPTGLAFIALSEKAWGFYKLAKCPKFYFDLGLERKANEKGETHFSSVVAHIRALDVVLDSLVDTALHNTIRRCEKLAEVTRKAGELYGFKVFSQVPSPAVTALAVPEGIDGAKLRDHLEKEYLVTVMGGQDQLKGKIIRIGHMGYITDDDMYATFEALGLALRDLGYPRANKDLVKGVARLVKESLQS